MGNLASEGGRGSTKEKNGKKAGKGIKIIFKIFNMNLQFNFFEVSKLVSSEIFTSISSSESESANNVQSESESETNDSEEEEKGIFVNVFLLIFCVFVVVTFQQFITF